MPTATKERVAESPPSKPATPKAPTIAPVPVPGGNGAHYSVELLEKARADADTVLKELGSQLGGLSVAEADSRLKQVGTNEIAREKRQSALRRLLGNVKNPLVLLLMALGVLSFLTGDLRATVVIFAMVVHRLHLQAGGHAGRASLARLPNRGDAWSLCRSPSGVAAAREIRPNSSE